MRFVSDILKFTAYITAGILLIYSISCLACGDESIPVSHLPAILIAAFATALISAFFKSCETKSRTADIIRVAVHFLMISAVMIPFGIYMGWVSASLIGALIMAGYVLAVYLLTFVTYYLTDLRDAEQMNAALKKRRQER